MRLKECSIKPGLEARETKCGGKKQRQTAVVFAKTCTGIYATPGKLAKLSHLIWYTEALPSYFLH